LEGIPKSSLFLYTLRKSRWGKVLPPLPPVMTRKYVPNVHTDNWFGDLYWALLLDLTSDGSEIMVVPGSYIPEADSPMRQQPRQAQHMKVHPQWNTTPDVSNQSLDA